MNALVQTTQVIGFGLIEIGRYSLIALLLCLSFLWEALKWTLLAIFWFLKWALLLLFLIVALVIGLVALVFLLFFGGPIAWFCVCCFALLGLDWALDERY